MNPFQMNPTDMKTNAQINEQGKLLLEEYDRLVKIVGVYSSLAEMKQRLAEETKETRAKAKVEADAEAQKIINDAKAAAKAITDDAHREKELYISGFEDAGKTRKEQIIKDAEAEAQSIRNSAETYAQKQKEAADKEFNVLVEKGEARRQELIKAADIEAQKIRKQADDCLTNARTEETKIKDKAVSDADTIRENAQKEMQQQREKLEEAKAEIEKERELVNNKKNDYEYKLNALDAHKEALEQSFEDRVDKECSARGIRCETAEKTLNDIRDRNKELEKDKEKYLEYKVNEKALNDLGEYRSELNALKKKLNAYEEKGITPETVDQFVNAENQAEEYADEIRDLKKKLEEKEKALLLRRNESVELDSEKERSKYWEDRAREYKEELERNQKVTREEMLSPIRSVPSFMARTDDLSDDKRFTDEQKWLENIKAKSAESGLRFSKRQIYAYHTAQKIRDMSPLVVLAGVSGTGKSELPKNYALHGGMNFLSIPVKPDWDSPASLFGYYNSIERRFEATDLVRALYQMSSDSLRRDQLMMVLLDEMNLAHPEQYFADMLSKLETCRGLNQNAQYDILLGGGESPERLDIGSNILWTGTMNEDETTKGLSDKVVDRSTLITFPRPKELYDREGSKEIKQEFFLSRKTWTSWCNKVNVENVDEVKKKLEEYRGYVQNINEQMANMGRNLGHRVWQGIAQYIEHYPDVVYARKNELEVAMNKAFGDAIAFKIMPKLRGVEVRGQNEECLNRIEGILSSHAGELVNDYKHARGLTTELFQWCSADFMNKDDE